MAILTENFYVDILLVLITIVMCIKYYYVRAFNYWKIRGVETLSPSFPFGNAGEFILQKKYFGDMFKDCYETMKNRGLRYCGFYSLTQPSLLLLDPELIKMVLITNFQHFTDRGLYSNEDVDPLSAQLLSLDGLKWRHMRSKLSPAFTPGQTKLMFNTLLNCTRDLKDLMNDLAENHKVLDAKEVFGQFTTDIMASCGFGVECNSLKNPNSEFRFYGRKVFVQDTWHLLKNSLSLLVPKLFDLFKVPVTDDGVTRFFMKIVKDTIKHREANNVVRNDFMHLLIQMKNNIDMGEEDNGKTLKFKEASESLSLTDEQIAAQAYAFFIAGFETTSTTLAFCIYELAMNIEIQEKLRQEVKDVLTKHDGNLTYDAIMEMTYMEKCISETLRKYPLPPVLVRVCTKPWKIPNSDLIINKGMTVYIPDLGIHYDPEYYPNPDKFDPERFTPESKSRRPPCTWLPFGEGPRNCIGIKFGFMQVKVGVAALLQGYKFTVNSKTKIPVVFDPTSIFAAPNGGIWLNVAKVN